MKIRAQIGKVLNLDKCIGCHTCAGLAHVHQRLPLQEDLLQLAIRKIGEVYRLLSAYRSRPADGVLGDLSRTNSLSRRSVVRRRSHRSGSQRSGRSRALSGAT
jgi:hypothetical protein